MGSFSLGLLGDQEMNSWEDLKAGVAEVSSRQYDRVAKIWSALSVLPVQGCLPTDKHLLTC